MTSLAARFAAFAGVGAIGTVAHYLTLILLVEAGGVNAALAAAAGAGLGAVINYTLNYHYTFRSDARHLDSLPKFGATAIVGMLLNALIVHVSVRWGAPYLAGQVLATGIVLLAGFASSQFWVFRKGGHGRTD